MRYEYLSLIDAVGRFKNIPYLSFGIGTRSDWVSNILLFIPIGYLWLAFFLDDRSKYTKKIGVAFVVVFLSFVFSVSLEFIQTWFPQRMPSLNDIVAETIGAVIGVSLWLSFGYSTTEWFRSFGFKKNPSGKLIWFLQAYSIGFLIYSFMPFDLTISLAELWHKFKQDKIIMIPFSNIKMELLSVYEYFRDIIIFIPIGMLVTIIFPLRECLLWGFLFVFSIEIGQLFVYSRSSDMTDIVLGVIGVGIGSKIMTRFKNGKALTSKEGDQEIQQKRLNDRQWVLWLGIASGYAFFLIVIFCYPFNINHDLVLIKSRYLTFFRAPFSVLFFGSEYNAISEILKKGLFFAPLGMLLGVSVSKISVSSRIKNLLYTVSLMFCMSVAVAIEFFQIFLPPKISDLTDVMLCSFGAAAGFFILLRVMGQNGESKNIQK